MAETINNTNRKNSHSYESSKAEQLGDLYGRMKYLMEVCQAAELWRGYNEVWQALHDLETEVRFHKPASPPYGHRLTSLRDRVTIKHDG